MTAPSRSPVVIDTGVYGAPLSRAGHERAFRYRALVNDRHWAICFVTVAELRFGASFARWGSSRLIRLESLVARAAVVWGGPQLLQQYADVRAWCVRSGHGLGQKDHEADRWVAATAMMLDIPLVAHDAIFKNVDGLELLTLLD